MIRQPSGITFEAEVGTADRLTLSVAEASRTLDVRLRESLWEDASNDPGMRGQSVDIESLAAFTLGTLLFGAKLYAADNVPRFAVWSGVARSPRPKVVDQPGALHSVHGVLQGVVEVGSLGHP